MTCLSVILPSESSAFFALNGFGGSTSYEAKTASGDFFEGCPDYVESGGLRAQYPCPVNEYCGYETASGRTFGFVDGPNVYTYVVQNPWTKFDPLGLAELKVNGEIWETPIEGDYDHPHVDPDTKEDMGPHMHHQKSGRKYFPQTNQFMDKDGNIEDAGNRFQKRFTKAVDSQISSPRIRAKMGMQGLGIIATAATIYKMSQSEVNAEMAEQLKIEMNNYHSAVRSENTDAVMGSSTAIGLLIGEYSGAAGKYTALALLDDGVDMINERRASSGSSTRIDKNTHNQQSNGANFTVDQATIVGEGRGRRLWSDGRKEIKLPSGEYVPADKNWKPVEAQSSQ